MVMRLGSIPAGGVVSEAPPVSRQVPVAAPELPLSPADTGDDPTIVTDVPATTTAAPTMHATPERRPMRMAGVNAVACQSAAAAPVAEKRSRVRSMATCSSGSAGDAPGARDGEADGVTGAEGIEDGACDGDGDGEAPVERLAVADGDCDSALLAVDEGEAPRERVAVAAADTEALEPNETEAVGENEGTGS